jgi:hypothetical protein
MSKTGRNNNLCTLRIYNLVCGNRQQIKLVKYIVYCIAMNATEKNESMKRNLKFEERSRLVFWIRLTGKPLLR